MKANFALSLSFDGIRLLHRAAGGWRFVGEVALTEPDLGGALSELRRAALALEPEGLRTKLIIPDSQIRYLTIDTNGLEGDALNDAARAALDGATPYAVSELAFDLTPDGAQTHIAAVARETLDEAETFAADHQFNPISSVAIPEDAPFLGEPFFGATAHAQTLLAAGEQVEPDGVAVVVLSPEGPAADVDIEVETEDPIHVQDDSHAPEPAESSHAQSPDITDAEEHVQEPQNEALSEPETPEPADLPAQEIAEPDVIAADQPDTEAPMPMPGFSSRRTGSASAGRSLGGVTRAPDTETTAPVATAPPVAPAVREPQPSPVASNALDVFDDVPGVSSPAANTLAGRSRSASSPGLLARLFGRKDQTEDLVPALAAAAPSALAEDLRTTNANSVRATREENERQNMTVFGARKPAAQTPVGGKPRFLGLILTAVLLVFLAGVAAFAALDESLSRLFGPRENASEPPVVVQDMLPPKVAQEPETQVAALETPALPPVDAPAPLAEPEAPPAFDPFEAEAQYAITGIWTIPPEMRQAPPRVGLDDLYIAAINRRSLSFDAVSLMPGRLFDTDEAPRQPTNPPAAGTRFDLDARGLVVPTPDGAISPDGVRVFLGRPASVPPARPQLEIAPSPDTQPQPQLAAFRPRLRPGDLVETNERQQLGGLSRSELAELRPRLRPETSKQEEEERDVATTEAVVTSPRPNARPRNFARIVKRARRAEPEQQEAPQQVAAVAPRTVKPSLPSRTSVTREATVRNAIKLNRINLMGVFGTPSDRRALVRLSNGRYKKVKVGDRIDGGRVSAIGDSELRYQKSGRNIVLKMPRT